MPDDHILQPHNSYISMRSTDQLEPEEKSKAIKELMNYVLSKQKEAQASKGGEVNDG